MPQSEAPAPLAGIRVVDFSQVIAGPIATYQLALMGADVLKIELPGTGDQLRRMGGEPHRARAGMGTGFIPVSAGKRSAAIDFKRPQGQTLARRLVEQADVVVENFRPGVMARYGLGWPDVRRLNPRAVYCSVSGFGQEGPWKDWPAYDHIVQGIAGVMMMQGLEGDPALKIGFPVVDAAAGTAAVMGIVTALLERGRTGEGRHVDVAMTTAILAMMTTPLHALLVSGERMPRIGNFAASGSPAAGTYATADGEIVMTCNTAEQFRRLCEVLERPDLAIDFDPASWRDPAADFSRIRGELAAVFRTRPAAEWEARLNAAGVPTGKVRSLEEALAEPQIAGRGFVAEIGDPAEPGTTVRVHGMPFRYEGAAFVPSGPVPRLGEHTREALEALGVEAGEIERLAAAGVIGLG